jgi:ribosomal protein L16 Arg81 hydroxylase
MRLSARRIHGEADEYDRCTLHIDYILLPGVPHMSQLNFGLAALVAPHEANEFLDNYWGKRAVHIEGANDKFSRLFDWDEVNNCLNHSRKSYDGMRLLFEKKELAPGEFFKLDYWLRKGATLVINQANDIDPIVAKFNTALARDLNTRVNTNCYVSCPTKQGFDTHFDQHDTIIIQTAGVKSWSVFEPTVNYPLHAQGSSHGTPLPESDPYLECELTPGDVLYIPRGHWHFAVAVSPSIHLTMGPESRSAVDFLHWTTNQFMNNDEFFRVDFPIANAQILGGDRDDRELNEHLETFRAKLREFIDGDAFVETLVRYCMSANPVKKTHQLPTTWTLHESITPDTLFEMSPDQKALVRFDDSSKRATVHIRGALVQLFGIPKEYLSVLFGQPGVDFSGQTLLDRNPDLEWGTLKEALLHLYDQSMITVSPKDSTQATS